MSLREPSSMDECVYFTNRTFDKGKIRAWVLREKCPKCGQGLMGKPRDSKTGKVKVRSEVYECPPCKYSAPLEAYEETLTASIKYTCPHCLLEGETQIPFIWKKVQVFDNEEGKKKTVDALRFQCEKCGKILDITKKMR